MSTTLLVMMPKCPFCLVGWMGALGLGGVTRYASHATLLPAAVLVLFCASQAVFFFTARRTGDLRALGVAALGVLTVLAGTQLHLGAAVCLAGVALLVCASVLNALATSGGRFAHAAGAATGTRMVSPVATSDSLPSAIANSSARVKT